jgi:hypothetical protein
MKEEEEEEKQGHVENRNLRLNEFMLIWKPELARWRNARRADQINGVFGL